MGAPIHQIINLERHAPMTRNDSLLNAPVRYSARAANLHASPIREILAATDRPGMISFAGGLPAAETFPALRLDTMPREWMQYGHSEGDWVLRAQIAGELAASGLDCAPEQVLVLSGSQQGIDLVAKLFVDEGTALAVESPTYLAALQVFRFFGARFQALCTDGRYGADWATAGSPRLAYTIPTFQNPTGRCLSAAERADLARACDEWNVPLFEDDPYRELAYDACERTPVCARLQRAPWIYQGSFSKSLAPGLRLGFLAASTPLVPLLTRLKQAADLHSSRISQWLVLEQLRDPARPQRRAQLVATYRAKRDHFAACLGHYLGDFAQWETPPGGLFFWLRLPRALDTRRLLTEALAQGVAFMPGEPFFPQAPQTCGALRLNFSHADAEQVQRGLQILAGLLRQAD
jgi:DNA-binding transcriptional MocR family regulator